MKKIITFITILFALATISAAARPSLDGRAVVAEAGEMPRGLFARTIGYLPGDSVSVTNPATGSSVDVLVLGAIDASEGVAILLSPEAADALNITRDSNVQVKITKRAGSLDEAVSGTAVLSEDEMDFNNSSISEANDGEDNQKPIANIEDGPVVGIENNETPAADESAKENGTVTAEYEELDDNIAGTENTETVEPEVQPETAVAETEPVEPVEITEPVQNEENVPPAEIVAEDKPAEVPEETPAELVNEDSPADADSTVPVEQIAAVDEIPPADETSEQTEIIVPDELPPQEDTPMDSVIADDIPPVQENIEEPAVEKEEEIAETTDDGQYNPIVLIPADENPPEDIPEPEEKADDVAVVVEPVLNTDVKTTEAAPVTEENLDFKKFVTDETSLEKGKYYIQIASLANPDNLNGLVNKYGSKYPVALIPLSDGKTYRTLVGPLTLDEYGSVLEKFRAFGFKDAFLRKIK